MRYDELMSNAGTFRGFFLTLNTDIQWRYIFLHTLLKFVSRCHVSEARRRQQQNRDGIKLAV
jgi:hypothetical protein